MQRLKFLEFALAAAIPVVHRMVRLGYNHYGPPLAEFCRSSVWLCDLAYVMLLPLESLAKLVQRFAGVNESQIAQIYAKPESEQIFAGRLAPTR